MLENTNVVARLVGRDADAREDSQHLGIDLSRVGLSGDRVDATVAHLFGHQLFQARHLVVVAVEQRQEARLRAGAALHATKSQAVDTLLELAWRAGKRTGIVTTSSITDATPASFVAHIARRFCEGPRDMLPTETDPRCPEDLKANGGRGSIAEQLAESGVELFLGLSLIHI